MSKINGPSGPDSVKVQVELLVCVGRLLRILKPDNKQLNNNQIYYNTLS